MVATKPLHELNHSNCATVHLHNYRCIRSRLGRHRKRQKAFGALEKLSESLALQSKGVVELIRGLTRRIPSATGKNGYFPIRQPNSYSIFKEAGGNEIGETTEYCGRDSEPSAPISDPDNTKVSTRQIQRLGRQPIPTEISPRMAPQSPPTINNFSENGDSRNRSLRYEEINSSTTLRERGSQRQNERIYECLQQNLEVQASMDFRSTSTDSAGTAAPQSLPRTIYNDSAEMGESFLETRDKEEGCPPTTQTEKPQGSPSGSAHEPPPSNDTSFTLGGLENTSWTSEVALWNDQEKELLQSAWRPSTLKTYKPAWESWSKWSRTNNVPTSTPKPGDLARYLIFLHRVRKLAYRTILVHKSVVATFGTSQNPLQKEPLGNHPIIKRTIKAILLENPPKHKNTTWNTVDFSAWLTNRNIDSTNLFQTSQHVATLLLLASGRRVHDLTLLHIENSSCQIFPDKIILWPAFGSKTDSINYRQSGWCLLKNSNSKLDLCYWIPALIKASEQRRKAVPALSSLFISTRGKVRAASGSVIAGWLRLQLRNANICDSPGSFRAAVASNDWSHRNLNIDEIMQNGNWRSANTFFKHYFREIENNHPNQGSRKDFIALQ